jgi:hypothetical protein
MPFKVGDRIQAIDGVCPGAYGNVTEVKSGDTYSVIYDGGRYDSIFGRMLVLADPNDSYDIDEDI